MNERRPSVLGAVVRYSSGTKYGTVYCWAEFVGIPAHDNSTRIHLRLVFDSIPGEILVEAAYDKDLTPGTWHYLEDE